MVLVFLCDDGFSEGMQVLPVKIPGCHDQKVAALPTGIEQVFHQFPGIIVDP